MNFPVDKRNFIDVMPFFGVPQCDGARFLKRKEQT
jgi:hypothetical protein